MALYRNFCTQDEIDFEYNLGARTTNLQTVFSRYVESSKTARARLQSNLDIRYGPTLDETLDLFPAQQPGSPLLVFIHGGYWRSMSSKEFSFVASGCIPNGVNVAITNYSLAPKVSIEEITRQSRAAVAWLYQNASRLGFDRHRIYVAGHSAGGHQAMMLSLTDWQREYGLPEDLIKGTVAVSGIYDLEPLRYSFLQPILQLDHEQIRRQSPIHHIRGPAPQLLAIVGEYEPAEFHRQSQDFVADWCAADLDGVYAMQEGADHFTVIEELSDPESILCARLMRVIKKNDH